MKKNSGEEDKNNQKEKEKRAVKKGEPSLKNKITGFTGTDPAEAR